MLRSTFPTGREQGRPWGSWGNSTPSPRFLVGEAGMSHLFPEVGRGNSWSALDPEREKAEVAPGTRLVFVP